MFRKEKRKQEFAVIGLGRFGRAVAKTLAANGYSVLGIDRDPDLVKRMLDACDQTVALDSTNEDALRAIDISSFDTVIVAIGKDFESNLITSVVLKSLGVRQVISKALTRTQANILERVGVDKVVLPEHDAGQRLGLELVSPNVVEHIPLGEEYTVVEMCVPPGIVGKTLAEIDFRNQFNVTVVAVKHNENVTVAPDGAYRLEEEDILVVIGKMDCLTKLSAME